MLAVDSSIFIDMLQGEAGADIERLEAGMRMQDGIALPPVTIAEMLSYAYLEEKHKIRILSLPMLDIMPGYWERAGTMRAALINRKFKPKLPDTLIARSCIDHDVPLLTRDEGFRIFEKHCGLKLFKAS